MIADVFKDRIVIRGIDDDRDGLVILRRAADHWRSADVDLVDRFRERDVRLLDRRFEWIQIHDDEIDRLETLLLRLFFVELVPALVK